MKDAQEGFGMLKKKKKDGLHVDLENEVNSIVVNNEEEKDVDGLKEKQVNVLLGIEINNNNNNNNNKRNNNNEWSWCGVVRR